MLIYVYMYKELRTCMYVCNYVCVYIYVCMMQCMNVYISLCMHYVYAYEHII